MNRGTVAEVTLERWQGSEHNLLPVTEADKEHVESVIRAIGPEWSALVKIEVANHQALFISANHGKYTVTAVMGEDAFYDLVGDPSANGYIRLVQGGQGVEIPARHCVDEEQAVQVSSDFVTRGGIEVDASRWERQGEVLD